MWECQNKTKKTVASHLEANGTRSNIQISDTLKSEHAEIRTCVCPKSPKSENLNWLLFEFWHCLKSERLDFRHSLFTYPAATRDCYLSRKRKKKCEKK